MNRTQNKKGYMKRYLAFNLKQKGIVLFLGAVFLAGVIVGCRVATGDNGIIGTILKKLLDSPSVSEIEFGFLQNMVSAFTTNGVLLILLFVCGFCAISQPAVLVILLFKGLGFGLMGGFLYGAGDQASILYYALVLLPEILLSISLLIAAAKESLGFTKNFLAVILPTQQEITEITLQVYCARFILYFLMNGMVSLLIALIKTSYFALLV